MRASVLAALFSLLALNTAATAERSRRDYPSEGFSVEFSGDAHQIDLKPNDRSSSYIRKTAIYEQHGDDYTYSVTAREYRLGLPNLERIAQLIKARLRCSGEIHQKEIEGGELAISGSGCLSGGSIFFARLLDRGRWFYQALAVVPQSKEAEGAQFVAGFRLTASPEQNGRETAKRPRKSRKAKSVNKAKPKRHATLRKRAR
jgi:hypothetical protein